MPAPACGEIIDFSWSARPWARPSRPAVGAEVVPYGQQASPPARAHRGDLNSASGGGSPRASTGRMSCALKISIAANLLCMRNR